MSALDKLVKGQALWKDADYEDAADELAALRARVAELEAAVAWALGYGDFPARQEGDGLYYWRKELRERAKLADEAARAALER